LSSLACPRVIAYPSAVPDPTRRMDPLERLVCQITGAVRATRGDRIQSLWGGYGELLKMDLVGMELSQVVVKHAEPPTPKRVTRVSASDRSHERKLRSYAVEMQWYREFAARCDADCRVPRSLGGRAQAGTWLFVLEDLDAAGFPGRAAYPNSDEIRAVLRWLATFHATFLDVKPEGLWSVGTYWHLATRPDELTRVRDRVLRDAASKFDARLNSCRYRTLVHGDAKVDNFCFSPKALAPVDAQVAAVDFQYVGAGCGMKDLAYFLSSVWESADCNAYAQDAISYYFRHLGAELNRRCATVDALAIEVEWRALYPVAWADFQRFLAGWAPGQYDDNPYARRMTQLAIESL
jgi:aminoglycoside phosphotransferase (APT) family kinase protein